MGSSLLVALGRSGVLVFVQLVTKSVLCSGGTGGNINIRVFSDFLVGLLGRAGGGLVDLVTDVVGSVPEDILALVGAN